MSAFKKLSTKLVDAAASSDSNESSEEEPAKEL